MGTVVGSTGLDSGTPNTALDDVCTTLATPASAAGVEQDAGAVDVDRAQQVGVAGQRHLGDVVVHDVDAVDGGPHGGGVADVGGDDLDARPGGAGDVDVEQPHVVAAGRRGAATSSWPK